MTIPTLRIANVDLPFIEYQGQPVVTFAMIDTVHQRPEGTARKRFNDNKRHFIDGEDFYRIDLTCASEFRTRNAGLFPAKARATNLISETGYLMLVKSFTDDLAWQVQRQLVKGYFRANNERTLPTTAEPIPERIDHHQRQQLREAVADLFNNALMRNDTGSGQWLYNRLRVEYSLKRIEDLPADDFADAMATVESLKPRISEYLRLEGYLRQMFYAQVIGQGEPWTSWIARQVGGAHKVPRNPDWPALARQVLEHHGLLEKRH